MYRLSVDGKNRVVRMFSSVQSLSRVWFFVTPWIVAHQASLSITNSRSLLKLMSIESVMPSNHLILCCPLLLSPSIFPSIRVFSNESVLHIRWPKCWSFSFSISPSNEYSGLISFRMDWLDLLAVQGTLKSLLQHHSSKAPIFWCSAFFIIQLSHLYIFPKLICKFIAILIPLLTGFWTKFDKLILKHIWKNKGPKVSKKILKNKNKEGDILLFQILRFIIELWSLKSVILAGGQID